MVIADINGTIEEEINNNEETLSNEFNAANFQWSSVHRSLYELNEWYADGDLLLEVDWQREYVWKIKQASLLIESFLTGIPVPEIFLVRTEDKKYEVIDGLQRLNSVFNFMGNKFKLNGLTIRTELNGKNFKSMGSDIQKELKKCTLQSRELSGKYSDNESDMLFHAFERLNTGGTKLNEMEIRNCIYRGPLNNLIKELVQNQDFRRCAGLGEKSPRFADREYVLRFLAFYEKTYTKYPNKGMKHFLNDFMSTYRKADDNRINNYIQTFNKCMRACKTVFGDKGFRINAITNERGVARKKANTAVYQVITTSFAPYDLGAITRVSDCIYEAYVDMLKTDKPWGDNVTYSNQTRSNVQHVFETWYERLSKVMENSTPNDKQRCFSRELKEKMYKKNKVCELCGNQITTIHDAALDHHKEYWRGGLTVPSNARLVHRDCNLRRKRY